MAVEFGDCPNICEEPNMGALRRTMIAAVAATILGAMPGPAWANADVCPPRCPTGKVKLGIAAPVSGPLADFGRQTVKAAEIAVRALNAAGGLMGVPVELAIGDDRCDVGRVASVAARHIEEDKIGFVIGPTCPPAAMAAAPTYAEASVIQFLPTVTTVGATWRNPGNLYRVIANDEQEAQAAGAYLARKHKGKKVMVAYIDSFYRRPMIEMIRAALPPDMRASASFEPLLDVPGIYDRLADKLQRVRPDVIYLALDAKPLVELIGRLRSRGIKALLVGGQHMLSFRLWRAASIEGIHVIAPIAALDDPEYRKAVDLLRQAEVLPDLVALNSYAAVQTWAEAVRRAGSGDPKNVAEALKSGEFKTVVGTVAFNRQGERRDIAYTIVTWQDERLIREVESLR
jgi:branched-chain amino acid transport system substrate-binding protein